MVVRTEFREAVLAERPEAQRGPVRGVAVTVNRSAELLEVRYTLAG
jgi:hypothetical protein